MQYGVLIGILFTLLSQDKVSGNQLSMKFEMSRRSIYRYIDALCQAGVPIYACVGKNGGYAIMDSFKIPSNYFTADEYTRLKQAVASFDVQDKSTTLIVDKLGSLERSSKVNYVLRSDQLLVDTPVTPPMQNKIDMLTGATVRRNVVTIHYHDKQGKVTVRSILPCAMLLKDGIWYVYAFCRLRNDYRFFKISRIASFTLESETFEQLDFDVQKAKNIAIPDIAPDVDCVFTLKESVLTQVEEWLGVEAVKQTASGYIATARLPFDDLLIGKLLSFGNAIKVLDTQKLRKAVAKALKATLNEYKDVD